MSDPTPPDDLEPVPPTEPEVAFVLPPPAYEAILTPETSFSDEVISALFPPAAPPEPHPALLAAIADLRADVSRRLDGLQTLFDREIRAEATREKVVDRLHAELQEYKQDLLLNALRPILIDLIQLHDDIGKLVEAQGEGDGEVGRLVGLMRGFQQAIEDILYRQGVEPFTGEDPTFDARRQRAVATVPTDDPAQAKAVAARLRKGFRVGERILRPEIVSVYAARR